MKPPLDNRSGFALFLKFCLAFHIAVFFSDFFAEDVSVAGKLDVLSVFFTECSCDQAVG